MNAPPLRSMAAWPPWRRRLLAALTLVAFVAVLCMLGGWLGGSNRIARWSIHAASTLYVCIAVASGGLDSRYGRLVLAGVCFCWLGDMIGPRNFLLGAGMFLLAHLFLIPAFLIAGRDRAGLLAGAVLYGGLSAAAGVFVFPAMDASQFPLLAAYTAVITAMGIAATGVQGTALFPLVPLAALLFYVSDLCLAQTAFLDGGPFFKYTGYPMYYTAVILLALSPALYRPEKEQAPPAA